MIWLETQTWSRILYILIIDSEMDEDVTSYIICHKGLSKIHKMCQLADDHCIYTLKIFNQQYGSSSLVQRSK